MPNMREIAPGLGIPRIQQNGNGHAAPPDPVREAIAHQRQLAATRMEAATAAQLTAQEQLDQKRLELEAQKLELEAEAAAAKLEAIRHERAKLAAAGNGQGGGMEAFAAMLQMFQASLQQQMESAAKQHEGLLVLLNDRIEAAQQAQQPKESPDPLAATTSWATQMKQLLELVDTIRPPAQQPQQGITVHEQIQLREWDLKAQERIHQLNEQAAIRLRELQAREQHRSAELALRERQVMAEVGRNDKFASLIEGMAPAALAAIQQAISSKEAVGGAQPEEQLDHHKCSACGGDIFTRPADRGHAVHCPHCNVILGLPAAAPG